VWTDRRRRDGEFLQCYMSKVSRLRDPKLEIAEIFCFERKHRRSLFNPWRIFQTTKKCPRVYQGCRRALVGRITFRPSFLVADSGEPLPTLAVCRASVAPESHMLEGCRVHALEQAMLGTRASTGECSAEALEASRGRTDPAVDKQALGAFVIVVDASSKS
jgi:hypothetical protein